MTMKIILCYLCLVSVGAVACSAQKDIGSAATNTYKFNFGATAIKGAIKVNALDFYTDDKGFGFENGATVTTVIRKNNNPPNDGFVTSQKPFLFSVKLPEGNYDVKVTLGDKEGTSDNVVRAECRRMMVNRMQTKSGELTSVNFTLHVRDTLIRATNNMVRIKPRERAFLHWDNKLTLEFNGPEPKLASIEIKPASSNVVTVFLAGNSTVVDQAEEPYAAWGQMIPAYFQPGKVVVANYAESGEALSSYIAERRFEKTLSLMKKGDYAFVEFGHNDMKQRGAGIGAFTSYTKDLKFFIAEVKNKGAIPVLVTSMQRRNFDSTGKINQTLGDYPAAVRQVAKEENVALIDLNAMSKTMYEAWGPKESIKAFVHFPANTFPNQKNELKDDTHFTPFGAYEICRIILKGIRENKLGLASFIKPGTPDFDPAKPDNFSAFYWPNSPSVSSVKPDGN